MLSSEIEKSNTDESESNFQDMITEDMLLLYHLKINNNVCHVKLYKYLLFNVILITE